MAKRWIRYMSDLHDHLPLYHVQPEALVLHLLNCILQLASFSPFSMVTDVIRLLQISIKMILFLMKFCMLFDPSTLYFPQRTPPKHILFP